MRRGVWMVLVLVACGEDHKASSDASVDAALDAPGGSCIAPGYGDSFDETVPCQMFGIQTGTGMASTANGTLMLTLAPGVEAGAACARQVAAWSPAGAFVEVSHALGVGQTFLAIQWGTVTTLITVVGGTISFIDGVTNTITQIPYDPVAHRWWRIRPVGGSIVGELSANGRSWVRFASADVTIDPTVGIAVGIHASPPEAPNNTATFEGIDVCPP